MKYFLILSLLILSACNSSPNRCNQKFAEYMHPVLAGIESAQFKV